MGPICLLYVVKLKVTWFLEPSFSFFFIQNLTQNLLEIDPLASSDYSTLILMPPPLKSWKHGEDQSLLPHMFRRPCCVNHDYPPFCPILLPFVLASKLSASSNSYWVDHDYLLFSQIFAFLLASKLTRRTSEDPYIFWYKNYAHAPKNSPKFLWQSLRYS